MKMKSKSNDLNKENFSSKCSKEEAPSQECKVQNFVFSAPIQINDGTILLQGFKNIDTRFFVRIFDSPNSKFSIPRILNFRFPEF